MQQMYQFIQGSAQDERLDRMARLLARTRINPYIYIREYLTDLQHEYLLTEGWLGNFFTRVKNAWGAFWTSPKEDNPLNRYQTAKTALQELISMIKANRDAGSRTLGIVLNGLEQSLNALLAVEPQIKQYSQEIMSYSKAQKTGRAFTPTIKDIQLPPDLEPELVQLLQDYDQIMRSPDKEEKVRQLVSQDDKFATFISKIENLYQNLQTDPSRADYRQQLGTFLKQLEWDKSFREFRRILHFARSRTTQGGMEYKPLGLDDLEAAWQQIASEPADPSTQIKKLRLWYAHLPAEHPIKTWIRQQSQGKGESEEDLFYQYATTWLRNKMAQSNIGSQPTT